MKLKAFTMTTVLLAIAGITLGIWFSPSHGEANEDRVQQIDITVVDDEGDQVIGAPVSVQRLRNGRWVSGGHGGSTDPSGTTTVSVATTTGTYRVVLTVPAGYSEDRDDADGAHVGPNGECSGMVNRCVAYVVDANQTVQLQAWAGRSDGMSVTFHVRDDVPEPRVHLSQYDISKSVAGTPLPGGTITVTPTRIVEIDGQPVKTRGAAVRYTTSTAGRTLFLDPGSYEIGWEPPAGYSKATPRWKYEVVVPPRGKVPPLRFDARTGGRAVEDSSAQPEGGSSGSAPQESQSDHALDAPSGTSIPSPSEPLAPPPPAAPGPTQPTPPASEPTPIPPTDPGSSEAAPSREVTESTPVDSGPAAPAPTEPAPVEAVPEPGCSFEEDPTCGLYQDWESFCSHPERAAACELVWPTSDLEIDVEVGVDGDLGAELVEELADSPVASA